MAERDFEMDMDVVNRMGGFLAGALIGALAGATAMLLFAPQSGVKTRKQIRRNNNKTTLCVNGRCECFVIIQRIE